ncbi:hypothetical protein CATRI_04860 [Corynebacterium atrinae]|uniref:hypothetical protein n=1 Tax=Corynebacterium atrinae TaxID=1336740 RepID=UPI0025B4B0A5|nr:hypothetical protein [Corynebacterium atrinae]WJY63065.1 hypothetical protein CATRI_04860 [Corynebacterium atrinae]
MSRRGTRILATSLAVATAATLTACTNMEPDRDELDGLKRSVIVLIAPNSMEQSVLAEIYQQVLQGQGRNTSLRVDTEAGVEGRIDAISSGEVDFIIDCSGPMLEYVDSAAANELAKEYANAGSNPNAGDLSERTYDEFVGSLPGSLATPDPSTAEGCATEGTQRLPHNIVPVYYRELFNRSETQALNKATRDLTTADLKELVESAKRESSISTVVAEWLAY